MRKVLLGIVALLVAGELLAAAHDKGVAVAAGNERAAERARNEFKINHH